MGQWNRTIVVQMENRKGSEKRENCGDNSPIARLKIPAICEESRYIAGFREVRPCIKPDVIICLPTTPLI